MKCCTVIRQLKGETLITEGSVVGALSHDQVAAHLVKLRARLTVQLASRMCILLTQWALHTVASSPYVFVGHALTYRVDER